MKYYSFSPFLELLSPAECRTKAGNTPWFQPPGCEGTVLPTNPPSLQNNAKFICSAWNRINVHKWEAPQRLMGGPCFCVPLNHSVLLRTFPQCFKPSTIYYPSTVARTLIPRTGLGVLRFSSWPFHPATTHTNTHQQTESLHQDRYPVSVNTTEGIHCIHVHTTHTGLTTEYSVSGLERIVLSQTVVRTGILFL